MIQIQTEPYSGPMDLLLELISKAKIDIYDIEISSITEEFLQAMQAMDISSEELSSFIQMASLLVVMKAKSLVADSEEDEEDEIISREELIRRLVEYKRFKALSREMRKLESSRFGILTKLPDDLSGFVKVEEVELIGDAGLLAASLKELLQRSRIEEKSFYVSAIMNADEYSLVEIQEQIRRKLQTKTRFSFHDLVVGKVSKARLIATFLSVLELNKSKEIRIRQGKNNRITLQARQVE